MNEPICDTCKRPENFPDDSKSELRPYGPGGSMICFRCAFATPEAEASTEANFGALTNAEIAATGVAIIGTRADVDALRAVVDGPTTPTQERDQ